MFGLKDKDIRLITETIENIGEIENAYVFGSRALGNYKKGSDVDIAIIGSNVTQDTVSKVSETLNEQLPLPYFFDILDYDDITNLNLTEHIDLHGIQIFNRDLAGPQHKREI
ncbi:nucleotidyltransferase domain-containing protein [Lentibacillus jeotgali]|uniref:nucleotidyltransferase domain-containing protein n=1 Tax=Lentibacillus jeotgali TaxID=558169 RepID=UPI000262746D|nr:nucleotidyltransferase domain-containing protein [Lentibacillus jeotgali]